MCIQSNLGHSTSRLQRLTKVSTPVYQKTDKRVVGFGPKLPASMRSEEHTSELQSRLHLVCRLLLEKKNNTDRLLHLVCAVLYAFVNTRDAVQCARLVNACHRPKCMRVASLYQVRAQGVRFRLPRLF